MENEINKIQALGKSGLGFYATLGRSGIFLVQTLVRKPQFKKIFFLTLEQVYAVGVLTLLVILVSGLFIGMVVGLQGFNTLNKFGAQEQLGQLLALSIVRELGPVVTALLFAGRACSSLTAEIGLMKATDQLSSMEMMGVDPLGRVVLPRLLAGFIALPILTVIFNVIAIWGGYLIGVKWLGIDVGSFWNNMQNSVDFYVDVLNGIIKSLVFGFVATWIAVFQGYDAAPTADGIARATTKTVVYASLAILGLDFVLTALMLGGW